MRRLLTTVLVLLMALPCWGQLWDARVRDPLTGTRILWSAHAECPMFTLPNSACLGYRSAARRWAVCEHPDCAATFDGKIVIASAGFGTIPFQAHRFNATTLAYVDTLQVGAFSTGVGQETNDILIGAAHRIPQVAAGANYLYFVINSGVQGGSASWYVYKIAPSGTAFIKLANLSMTTAAHWSTNPAVPQIGGSNIADGYYYGAQCVTIGESPSDRLLVPGRTETADGKGHATIMYSDEVQSKGTGETAVWTMVPVFIGGNEVMSHVAEYAEEDGDNMLVGVVTTLYGQDYINIVYNENRGADGDWKVASVTADGQDMAIAAGGVAYNHADVVSRRVTAAGTPGVDEPDLSDSNYVYGVNRVIYDATSQTAWVSLTKSDLNRNVVPDPVTGAETTAQWLLKIDMTDRGTAEGKGCVQTLYGPLWTADKRSPACGMDIAMVSGQLTGIIPTPHRVTSPYTGYHDYPEGAESLAVSNITFPGGTCTLTQTASVSVPRTGCPSEYYDRKPDRILHEYSYGNGQVFMGWRFVQGDSGKLAVMIGNQRVPGTYMSHHASQVDVYDLTNIADKTTPTGSSSQVVVVPNFGCLPTEGFKGTASAFGVADYDSDLNVGSGELSIVAFVNLTGTIKDQPVFGVDATATTYWGYPLVIFAEMPVQGGSALTYPVDGFALFMSSAAIRYWQWNGWNGTVADTTHCLCLRNSATGLQDKTCGQWARYCITKKASATATTDFKQYLNGASAGAWNATLGTGYDVGDVDVSAKLRFFHMVNSYGRVSALYCGGAGVWIYNRELTATEAANVTKAPGASGQVDPESLSGLVGRTYSGVGNWRAFGGQRREGGGLYINPPLR